MSASRKDRSCPHCGIDWAQDQHFVYDYVYVRNTATGTYYTKLVVHPCVYKYEQDNQLGPVGDYVLQRIVDETVHSKNKRDRE